MSASEYVTVSCNDCGRPCSLPWVQADEFGGQYVCSICRNDAMPPEALNDDDAPVRQK
jgi:hypothetical protein